MQFHDYTPADVVVPGDPSATARAVTQLSRTARRAGQQLRLTVLPDDLDVDGYIRYSKTLMMCSAVVVLRTPDGLHIKKHVCHRDDALKGLTQ